MIFKITLAALVLASQIVVAHAAGDPAIPHAVPSQVSQSDISRAQAATDEAEEAKPPRPKTEAEQRQEEQAAALRAFIRDKVKTVMGSGIMKGAGEVMPQLWQPFKLAVVVLFLIAFVAAHFQRQKRAMLEAQQARELSPAEVEFGRDPDYHQAGGHLPNQKETGT